MRKEIQQKLTFISKSLLWSLLLYFFSMALINWDEVRNSFHKGAGGNIAAVHIVPAPQQKPVADIYSGDDNAGETKKNIEEPGNILASAGSVFQLISKIAGIGKW